ncbi:unnamed protein product [Strongylus vulgaris]|uniref:Uncharacterized protein n=1 Tax=Strongylus vulgaris TaxID=40348 RepID=A0A3P7KKN8_STRVU|nr:unnamed protein product [Strongylus vulgaris]
MFCHVMKCCLDLLQCRQSTVITIFRKPVSDS